MYSSEATAQEAEARGAALVVTSDQRELYERQGYLVIEGMLTSEELSALRADYRKCVSGEIAIPSWKELEEGTSAQSQGGGASALQQLAEPSKSAALAHWEGGPFRQKSLALAKSLAGVEVEFAYDQIFFKAAGCQTPIKWHQDAAYWGDKPGITCWLAVEDVATEMGALNYLPGSHRFWFPHETSSAPHNGVRDLEIVRNALSESDLKFRVSVELKAGDCVFHHPRVLHGSGANNTTRDRCGLTNHFIAPGAPRAELWVLSTARDG